VPCLRKYFNVVRKSILLLVPVFLAGTLFAQSPTVVLSKATLKDKIMGGCAGQTIGVTFGGPYEFRFQANQPVGRDPRR